MEQRAVRRAKIVCTLGPVSNSPEMIDRLLRAGMDVVRLNFSHGVHAEHARVIETVRALSRKNQKPVAIVADLQGPKIRTGLLAQGKPVQLKAGQRLTITTRRLAGDDRVVSTDYRHLPQEVRRGDRILLSDGLIELTVLGVRGTEVACEVVNGGELGEHKGINLPGIKVRVRSLTPKDRADMAFALEHGVDYVAVSFVRTAQDVRDVRALARRLGKDTRIIAKIEKTEALDNLDAILDETDAVMVARGDLGVEMRPEKVPVVQKLIIDKARQRHMPVITATQMLSTMTRNPRPTRAEASDVANAVFDGTSALMLSEETAAGRYPLESVEMMTRIIGEAEASSNQLTRTRKTHLKSVAGAVSEAVCTAAEELGFKAIAVFTETGKTALTISHYRPPSPIIAFSPNQATRRRLGLVWGVLPRKIKTVRDIDALAATAEKRLIEEQLVRRGDLVGIVAGTPLGIKGTTNLLKIHRVGGR